MAAMTRRRNFWPMSVPLPTSTVGTFSRGSGTKGTATVGPPAYRTLSWVLEAQISPPNASAWNR